MPALSPAQPLLELSSERLSALCRVTQLEATWKGYSPCSLCHHAELSHILGDDMQLTGTQRALPQRCPCPSPQNV